MVVFAGAVCRCLLGATSYGSPPSRARPRRTGPPSRCRDRRSQSSRRATALRAQSELPTEHGAWAAVAARASQAAFLRCSECGRLRSLHPFSITNRYRSRFAVATFAGFDFVLHFPVLRQTQQFSRRHLDQREHLAALGDQRVVLWPCDAESAPESCAFKTIQPTLNQQPVAEPCRASIIDLGADYNRIRFLLRHLHDR